MPHIIESSFLEFSVDQLLLSSIRRQLPESSILRG